MFIYVSWFLSKKEQLYFHGAHHIILVILSLYNVIFLITFLRGSETSSPLIKNRGFKITEIGSHIEHFHLTGPS